jgi:hypothetical protein
VADGGWRVMTSVMMRALPCQPGRCRAASEPAAAAPRHQSPSEARARCSQVCALPRAGASSSSSRRTAAGGVARRAAIIASCGCERQIGIRLMSKRLAGDQERGGGRARASRANRAAGCCARGARGAGPAHLDVCTVRDACRWSAQVHAWRSKAAARQVRAAGGRLCCWSAAWQIGIRRRGLAVMSVSGSAAPFWCCTGSDRVGRWSVHGLGGPQQP